MNSPSSSPSVPFLIKGGRLIDPAHHRDEVLDLLVENGKVLRLGKSLPAPAGAHVWSKMYGSPQDQAARFLSVDASDNLVFTGATVGPVDFGAGLVGGGGKNDVFYTKLDPAGAVLFSYAAGDGADQFGANVVLDAASNGYLVGRFDGMLDFGAGNVLTGQGPDDAFIAKLAP